MTTIKASAFSPDKILLFEAPEPHAVYDFEGDAQKIYALFYEALPNETLRLLRKLLKQGGPPCRD